MERQYSINKKLKNVMLEEWLKTKHDFRKRLRISKLFMVIALLCIVGWLLVAFVTSDDGAILLMALAVGFLSACVPFFIGQSIGIRARKSCGSPYIEMEREYISVSEFGVEFGYHDTQNMYADSMDIYQIRAEDINDVKFDRKHGILTIVGKGSLTVFDDFLANRINYAKSQRKFYSDSSYSFILAFDKQDEIVEQIQKIMKKEED